MEQALAPAAVPLPDAAPGPLARLAAMPAAAKMKVGGGLAALVAVVIAIGLWSSQGDYRVLFANLPDKEGGAVVAQLAQMQVPYKFAEGGSAILVPADKVNEVRLKLASQGLPKSSVVGFELMDNARFGQTQTQERVNLQRALEGELTRTISSIDAVESARVHLALPNQNGFFREQQKPSASVVLMLRGGRVLDRAQLAGIVHLVASSVPELQPKDVSVLDQTGTLLTQNGDHDGQGLDPTQLQYVNQMEGGYVKRIQELLEPVVGAANLRATVTADVDFSQSDATSEQFKPNQGDPKDATVRSQQLSDTGTGANAVPSGVPGATSNTPPVPATAPINGASAPLQAAQGGSVGPNGHRETVTNYEVDRTVRVARGATGLVRRLNAAVVVNQKTTTDAKGKTTTTPLTQEEMDKLTALVQEAIGYDKDRGDSVKVINAPFKVEAAPKEEELPLWKQQWLLDLLRAGGVPAGLTLVALAVLFGLVRPAVMAALAKPVEVEKAELDVVAGDHEEVGMDALPEILEAPQMARKLESARQLAKENPIAVANIVRDWVNGEASA
ncbi:MAG TPA: flagellar basal-body MS-ring/collar protein FliF [Burkholderiaceae bacterium]